MSTKTVNLVESTEHVLTPPDIGPVIQFGSRVVDLRSVEPDLLERMLQSPLTENFLNRDKRRAAKLAPPAPATGGQGKKKADEEK